MGKLETMCLIELLMSRKPEIETGSYTWLERPSHPIYHSDNNDRLVAMATTVTQPNCPVTRYRPA